MSGALASAPGDTLLSVREVSIRFGGIVALDRVSFDVPEGSIVGVIGPNGAGKTTLFNVMTRLYRQDHGEILFAGRTLLRAAPHEMVGRGIARTFQNLELCRGMTVLDNVLVGDHHRLGAQNPFYFLLAGIGWPGVRRQERAAAAAAEEMLDFVGVRGVSDRPPRGLPFGTLKAVELARALISKPRLLLLDEPAGGLNHEEVLELGRLIQRINKDLELTVLVVEHHMNLVMSIVDKVVVLDFGRKIAEGTPKEVQSDQRVIEAYLGVEEDD